MGVPVNVAGQIAIGTAAALCLGAVAAGLAGRRGALTNLILGALCLTVGAMTMLLTALLRHDFGLAYVVRHTSLDLPRPYCFAALWAGQEGTILLWVAMLLAAALAVVTKSDSGRRGAGTVLAALAVGFFALLVIRSPFAAVTDGVPADGQGLNPLLRNPWMIIHPPVLFAGYALLAVPFGLAVAGFWRGDIDGWIEAARPWLLAAWFLLGAGMMLGAYWAYITLGWGGFWAWDPVENSSLIPWLFATTFLHAMLLHRRCGAFRRATYVLATLSFATVVYGSYLTRSGVLGEFSVHSFESLGRGYNALWLALLAAPLGAGLGLCWSRRRKSAGELVPPALNLLAQATWLLAIMSVFVLVGTSAPLLTGLLGKSSAVEPTFYNRTQTAFFGIGAVLLILLLPPRGVLARLLAVAAAALAAGGVWSLVRPAGGAPVQAGLAVLGLAAGAMLVVAGQKALDGLVARRLALVGAGLAHGGAALLVLGAVLSGPGARDANLTLRVGQTSPAPGLGTSVTYERTAVNSQQQTEHVLRLGDGRRGTALNYTTNNGMMRHPAVFHGVSSDIYLEPQEFKDSGAGQELTVHKGSTETYQGLKVTFEAFEMDMSHMAGGGAMEVGCKLSVDDGHGPQTVVPKFVVQAEGHDSPSVAVGQWQVRVEKIMAGGGDKSAVVLRLSGAGAATQQAPELVLKVTRKPWIGLVWLGTLVLLAGGLLALLPGGPRPAGKSEEKGRTQ